MPLGGRARAGAAVALATALLFVACGGDDAGADDSVAAATTPGEAAGGVERSLLDGQYPRFVDRSNGLITVLGTPDLAVGRHRVGFVLSDAEGLIRLPVVRVESLYLGEEGAATPGEPVAEALARFSEFPFGVRGIYVAELEFDRAGGWALRITVPRPDGTNAVTAIDFAVAARTLAPAVGEAAPRSSNRIASDVESLHELSTGAEPDPALYELTIAQALDEALPLVIVFASPGFCTNALCGPQAEVLSELRQQYQERANFIHVDLYTNPTAIRSGGLQVAERTAVLAEWGLVTSEWTFVIDASGSVAARFEAFAPFAEVEAALLAVLDRTAAARSAGR